MGYSPTEYAEFTEPPTEMSSHGFHRSAKMLGCAVLPQNSQNSQNLSAWVWQGCHTLLHLCSSVSSVGGSSLQEVLCIRCIPWELLHRLFCWCSFCSGKRQSRAETAAPPGLAAWVWQECHTLLICAHPCSSVGVFSLPEVSVSSVRSVGISFLPQNSQNSQNLVAWVWQGCHTLLHLCASVPSVGGSSLQEVLCIRCIPWEFLHRLFGWCSRDCCTPWRNPRKLVRTSHHLTISPQQHPFTSNPAFCMSSQYCGYDFVTTCGSLMRSPGNTIAAGANAIAMRWSS